jgi:hypothetical protein
MSDVVNEALRQTLSEDAADLEVFEKRRRETSVGFDEVVLRLDESKVAKEAKRATIADRFAEAREIFREEKYRPPRTRRRSRLP